MQVRLKWHRAFVALFGVLASCGMCSLLLSYVVSEGRGGREQLHGSWSKHSTTGPLSELSLLHYGQIVLSDLEYERALRAIQTDPDRARAQMLKVELIAGKRDDVTAVRRHGCGTATHPLRTSSSTCEHKGRQGIHLIVQPPVLRRHSVLHDNGWDGLAFLLRQFTRKAWQRLAFAYLGVRQVDVDTPLELAVAAFADRMLDERCLTLPVSEACPPINLALYQSSGLHTLHQSVLLVTPLLTWRFPSNIEHSMRQEEFIESLQWNLCHEEIESVHLLLESETQRGSLKRWRLDDSCGKISVHVLGSRLHYASALRYANDNLPANTVFMIANSDTYLGHGFRNLSASLGSFDIVALSRSERTAPRQPTEYVDIIVDCCNKKQYDGCTDAFMLRSPVPSSVLEALTFPQNVWGAENRLLYEFSQAGYIISNPCLDARLYHNHASHSRGKWEYWGGLVSGASISLCDCGDDNAVAGGQNKYRVNTDGKNRACCPSKSLRAGCAGCICKECGLNADGKNYHPTDAGTPCISHSSCHRGMQCRTLDSQSLVRRMCVQPCKTKSGYTMEGQCKCVQDEECISQVCDGGACRDPWSDSLITIANLNASEASSYDTAHSYIRNLGGR